MNKDNYTKAIALAHYYHTLLLKHEARKPVSKEPSRYRGRGLDVALSLSSRGCRVVQSVGE